MAGLRELQPNISGKSRELGTSAAQHLIVLDMKYFI